MASNISNKKVVVITGGTSGIGLASAEIFANNDWQVACFSRKAPNENILPENAEFFSCDVRDSLAFRAAMEKVYERFGRIDVLVSNAGFGISGPLEFTSDEDAKAIIETNFLGGFYGAKAVLPYMRERGQGRIIYTSSLAAIMPIPFQSFYSATKASINLMAGALDNEVKQFGVRVVCIMPGDVKTGFTAARKKSNLGDEIYGKSCEKAVSTMEHDEESGMDPAEIAAEIYKAATAQKTKPWYIPGSKYKFFALLYRLLPAKFVYWLIGKVYLG